MDTSHPASTGGQRLLLQNNAALLRNLVENAGVPTFVVVKDSGQVVYANRAFAELLGYDPEECIGIGIAQIVHPDDAPLARAQTTALRAGEIETYQAERRYLRKDGRSIWVKAYGALVTDALTGDARYMTVQAIDIDRQKRAEASLAAAEQRWNLALERAGQGVWDRDLNRSTMFYSSVWRTMRGFAPDAEIDTSEAAWLERLHPDDRERIQETVRAQDAGEIPRTGFVYRERHREGHYVWILSRGGPVEWDENGVPTRILGTDTDISALKAVEAALAVEKERLRVTLQSIGDGVISADADARVSFMNPMAEEMTGWKAEEAIGRKVQEVFAVVDDVSGESVADPVSEALARRELFYLNGDAVLVSRSGERRAIRDSAAPVRTPDGELLGAVLVFQDITQARALQKELAHSAVHDSLTGLPNRKAFERAMTEALDQARREQREHALCFIDLDRFKTVNDTAGHAAGDALLQQVSHAIRRACRTHDFTARIGGDEFAILLTDCSLAGAKKAAQQVVDIIAAIRFTWQGRTYTIGASVGIAPITSKSPYLAELMGQADSACYAAKNAGGNRATVFDPAHQLNNFAQIA